MIKRVAAIFGRVKAAPKAVAVRTRAVVASSGPSNVVGLAGVVVLDATIVEQWGRLAGQGFAGVVLVWVAVALEWGRS